MDSQIITQDNTNPGKERLSSWGRLHVPPARASLPQPRMMNNDRKHQSFEEWKLTTFFLIGMVGGDLNNAEKTFDFQLYYLRGYDCMEAAAEYLKQSSCNHRKP